MTALIDAQPVAPEPEPSGATPSPPMAVYESPIVTIYANLLPQEVIASRRLAGLKRRLFAALVLVALLLGAGYAYSWWQTSQADDNLAYEKSQSQQLSQQLNQYTPLLQAQASAAALQAQVTGAMANDLQWSSLVAKIRAAAPAGLVVSQVSGSVTGSANTGGGAAAAADPLAPANQVIVGQVSLSGTARSYRDVATFVDSLGRVKGLAVANPGSISGAGQTLSYSMTLSLTSDALGGRFAPKPTSSAAPSAATAPTPATSGPSAPAAVSSTAAATTTGTR